MLAGAASCTSSGRPSTTRWPRPGTGRRGHGRAPGQHGAEEVAVDVDVGLEEHTEPGPAHAPPSSGRRASAATSGRPAATTWRREPGGGDERRPACRRRRPARRRRRAATAGRRPSPSTARAGSPAASVTTSSAPASAQRRRPQREGGDEEVGRRRGPQPLGQQDEGARAAGAAAAADEDVVARVEHERRRPEVGIGDPDGDRPAIRSRASAAGGSARGHVGRQHAERCGAAVGWPRGGPRRCRRPTAAPDGVATWSSTPVSLSTARPGGSGGPSAARNVQRRPKPASTADGEGAGPVGGGRHADADGRRRRRSPASRASSTAKPAGSSKAARSAGSPSTSTTISRAGRPGASPAAIDLGLQPAHEPGLALPVGGGDDAGAVGQRGERRRAPPAPMSTT